MKTNKRIAVWLCLVLTVLMVASVFPAAAISATLGEIVSTGPAYPAGTGEVTVNTGNPAYDATVPVGKVPADYAPVGNAINTAEDFAAMDPAGNYYLNADITVDATYAGFRGTFDGNGRTITTSVPVFNAPKSATIKNLTVEGAVTIVAEKNTAAVSGGTAVACNFFNILNRASVSAQEGESGKEARGSGIVGRVSGKTTLERLTNEGTINGQNICAGICALVSADPATSVVIVDCTNTGAITSNATAAGVVSTITPSDDGEVTYILNCKNTGAVTADSYAGGISANLQGKTVRVENCTNEGVITANENQAGGIVAQSGTKNLTFKNCVNTATGKVYAGKTSTSSQRNAGGILGRSETCEELLFVDCTNAAYIEGSGQSGGIAGWGRSHAATAMNCKNTGEITSRLNYAGGLFARLDVGANYYLTVDPITITDCHNEGKITSYTGSSGGVFGYSETPVYFENCTNKGLVTYRADSANTCYIAAGGIAGSISARSSFTNCRNEGAVIGKAKYTATTVEETGVTTYTSSSGYAGGILGQAGMASGNYRGPVYVTKCVNLGNISMELGADVEIKATDVLECPTNAAYAGGLVGYMWGGGTSAYPVLRFNVNVGNVTAIGVASLALGYSNLTYIYAADNVLLGTLASVAYPDEYAGDASVLNTVLWDNASKISDASFVERNYVNDLYPLYTNTASSAADAVYFEDTDSGFYVSDPETFDWAAAQATAIATYDKVTEITDADALKAIKPFGNYKLTANINMSGLSSIAFFGGTLDGNGMTVTVDSPLFETLGTSAVIKNLTIAGEVNKTSGAQGALAVNGGGFVQNVINNANVTTAGARAGGFFAQNNNAFIRMENCINKGTITTSGEKMNAGGFVAYLNSTISQMIDCVNDGAVNSEAHTGGVVGEAQRFGISFVRCINNGAIETRPIAAGDVGVAGIVGYNGTAEIYVAGCTNNGTVKGDADPNSAVAVGTGKNNIKIYASGIIGDTCKGSLITDCLNTGAVTSKLYASGITGRHGDTGAKFMTVRNCVNTGAITGVHSTGGIISYGGNNGVAYTLENCVNLGTIKGENRVGGIFGGIGSDGAAMVVNLTGCVNLGDIVCDVDGKWEIGSLAGYVWGTGTCYLIATNCVAGGTVTTNGPRIAAVLGYSNAANTQIKNCLIFAKLTPGTGDKETYAFTGGNGSVYKAANASNNIVVEGSADYEGYKTKGETKYDLGQNSTNTRVVSGAADFTNKAQLLMRAGIMPDADGFFPAPFDTLLPDTYAGNIVEVYNGEEVADTFSSLTEATAFAAANGYTVKLAADYYTATTEHLVAGTYTVEGNSFAIYSAAPLAMTVNGNVTLNGVTIYAEKNGVRFGEYGSAASFAANFNDVKIFAGGTNATGENVMGDYGAINVAFAGASLTIDGAETFLKGAKYETVMWDGDMLQIKNGTIHSKQGYDGVVRIASGTGNLTGGNYSGNGMCVVRTLGGLTANENGEDNTIKAASNATLNISGGTYTLEDAYTSAWGAVVRTGGGNATSGTYGVVNIMGGTFINNCAKSEQVVYRNNTCSSLYVTGGKFYVKDTAKYFVKVNPGVNVTLEDGYTPTSTKAIPMNAALNYKEELNGTTYNVHYTYGATNAEIAPEMLTGAQVRATEGSTGIRFISTISKAAIDKATVAGATVSYGTLITTMNNVKTVGAFTHAALAGHSVVDIPAVQGMDVDEQGNVTIRAALTNIKAENYELMYAAISYIKVTVGDVTTYYYGEFSVSANVRSIRAVATVALADTAAEASEKYCYTVLAEDGVTVLCYSPYNRTQRNAMTTFVAPAPTPDPAPDPAA